MKKIVCEMCGSTEFTKVDGFMVCQSCGIKYTVEEAKKLMVEVEGDVPTQQTAVSGDSSEKLQEILKRGFIALEDEKWDKATSYFDQVLDIDTECADAYFGLAIAKKKIKDEWYYTLFDDKFFLKAVRFKDNLINKDKYLPIITKVAEFGQSGQVVFPEDLTSIPKSAFLGCSNLTSITIPNSVTSIGEYAFADCKNLTSITIPSSVTSIGDSAFSDSALTSVTFEEGSQCESIGERAFSCAGLTSITIPNSVKTIGKSVFFGCHSFKEITLPFVGHSRNETTYGHLGYLWGASTGGDNEYYVPKTLKTVVLTDATSISDMAFADCPNITDVVISNGVTNIGSYAFNKCSRITSITIPSSVTSIGNGAFSNSALTSVTFEEGSQCESIGENAFFGCASLTSITIPNSVKTIGKSAFWGCSRLVEISLPFVGRSVDEIENIYSHFGYIFGADSCFDNKNKVPASLKTVVLTGGTKISEYAFKDCSNLTSITIPASVESVAINAFYDCSIYLKKIYQSGKGVWQFESAGKTHRVELLENSVKVNGSAILYSDILAIEFKKFVLDQYMLRMKVRGQFELVCVFTDEPDMANLERVYLAIKEKAPNATKKTGGCYIATSVYGSYDCPQVWTLRRYRDEVLGSTWYGRLFIKLYYAISPTLVKWFGKTKWFQKMWQGKLDKMVAKLNAKGFDDTPYDDKDWN